MSNKNHLLSIKNILLKDLLNQSYVIAKIKKRWYQVRWDNLTGAMEIKKSKYLKVWLDQTFWIFLLLSKEIKK